jgi:hypothetical protein
MRFGVRPTAPSFALSCALSVCVALGAAPAAAPVAAQEQEPEVVPMELVRLLVATGGSTDVLVGELPAQAETVPLPEDARVIGGLVAPRRSQIAVAVPADAETVRTDWPERLEEAGWGRFEDTNLRSGFHTGGQTGLQFCRDATVLTLHPDPKPDGGAYVTISLWATPHSISCEKELERRHPFHTEPPVPPLENPVGARASGGGSGGSMDDWSTRVVLKTGLSPRELIEYYDPQLQDAGWTPGETVAGDDIALTTYRVTDEDGVDWHGVLMAVASDENTRHVELRTVTEDVR